MELASDLRALRDLLTEGLLNEAEYEDQRAAVLARGKSLQSPPKTDIAETLGAFANALRDVVCHGRKLPVAVTGVAPDDTEDATTLQPPPKKAKLAKTSHSSQVTLFESFHGENQPIISLDLSLGHKISGLTTSQLRKPQPIQKRHACDQMATFVQLRAFAAAELLTWGAQRAKAT